MFNNMVNRLVQMLVRHSKRTVPRRNKCHYTNFGAHNVAMNLSKLSFHPIKSRSNVQNAVPPILSACYPSFLRAERPVMSELLQLRLADHLLKVFLERKFISAVG
jgi:hypothetical protein